MAHRLQFYQAGIMSIALARVPFGGKWRRLIHCDNCGRQAILEGRGLCKTCYSRWHYTQNKEKYHAAGRRYYARNLEKEHARRHSYYALNRERESERNRRYREEHPERRKATEAAYRARNREKERARAARYRKEHPDRRKAACKSWYEQNKEQAFAQARQRRGRKLNAPGNGIDERLIYRLFKRRCAYCGTRLHYHERGTWHIDHVVPLSKGGADDNDNAALACAPCNLSKGNREAGKWLQAKQILV